MLRALKILGIFSVGMLLSGCLGIGESGGTVTGNEATHRYATDEFSVEIPNEWEVITPRDFSSKIPQNTLVAFRSNIKNPKFTATVAVLKNTLVEDISPLDYAKALKQKTSQELSRLQEITVEPKRLKIGEGLFDTLYVVLQGSEATDADVKQFAHLSGVKGKVAFVIVGSATAQEDAAVIEKMKTIVQSLEIK